jgi:hypothetical protein
VILLFSITFKPFMGLTQSPIPWVPRVLSPRVKQPKREVDPSLRLRLRGVLAPIRLQDVLQKRRGNFNSLFVFFLVSIEIVFLYVVLHRPYIDFPKCPRSRLGVKYVDHDRRPGRIVNGIWSRGRIIKGWMNGNRATTDLKWRNVG